jgi:hypothetical protein
MIGRLISPNSRIVNDIILIVASHDETSIEFQHAHGVGTTRSEMNDATRIVVVSVMMNATDVKKLDALTCIDGETDNDCKRFGSIARVSHNGCCR